MKKCVSDVVRSLGSSSIGSNFVSSVNTTSANVVPTTMIMTKVIPARPVSKRGKVYWKTSIFSLKVFIFF